MTMLQLVLDEDSKHLGIPRQQLLHLPFEVLQAVHLFQTEYEARYALGSLGLLSHVAQLDIVQMRFQLAARRTGEPIPWQQTWGCRLVLRTDGRLRTTLTVIAVDLLSPRCGDGEAVSRSRPGQGAHRLLPR